MIQNTFTPWLMPQLRDVYAQAYQLQQALSAQQHRCPELGELVEQSQRLSAELGCLWAEAQQASG